MSKFGLILCLVYVAISALCVWAGLTSSQDPKGSFVALQLPLAPQAALLYWLGVGGFLKGLSWPAAYAVIGIPTLGGLYAFGAVFGSMGQRVAAEVQRHAP